MMQLLTTFKRSECPPETLLVRIRSRRKKLDFVDSGDRIDTNAAIEWLFARIDRRTHRLLEPYFELLATRHLCQLLRYRLAGEQLPSMFQHFPLFNADLQDFILSSPDGAEAVPVLENALKKTLPWIDGITASYLRHGPGGVEQHLETGCLVQGLRSARHALVRQLIRHLLDTRNLLGIMRHWRWHVSTPPVFAQGGQFRQRALERLWRDRNQTGIAHFAERLAKGPVTVADPRQAEREMLSGLSSTLRRAGRDPLGVGVHLDYLWRLQLAAVRQRLQDVHPYESRRLSRKGEGG